MTLKRASRLEKVRQAAAAKDVEAILISQPENQYYLSNFDGEGFLLITPQQTLLATDFRYTEQARQQAPDWELFQITGSITDWFPRLIADLKITSLGFEAGSTTLATYQKLVKALDESRPALKFIPLEALVESIRAIKEPEEIEFITIAAEISDSALEYIEDVIRPGMSEEDIAWEIEKYMRDEGSQTMPFEVMVASGPNAALPHAKPTTRTINSSEPIVVDIGAKFEGYASDLSRTICLGTPGDTLNKVYEIVLSAQLTAIDKIRHGMTGSEIDSLARTIIEQAGYGEAFGHGLGHGVGLAIHEHPTISQISSETISENMVFTIEPGIYLPGWGGVRIEDLVVIENGKAKVISKARKL